MRRKQGIIIILLIFVLIVTSSIFCSDNAYASTDGEKCYSVTPKLTEAAFNYMQEVYTERYPQFGLRFLYGTEQDKKELKKLADMIVKDSATDREKTKAMIEWTRVNIFDYGYVPAFPMDTFHSRKGVCANSAMFISQLLRLEGIPAVMVDGWRADMKKYTQKQLFQELADDGHAWILVYLDSKWTMFDPLWTWSTELTDRDYINRYYYFASIEGINITYDGMDLDNMAYDSYTPYYSSDGKFRFYRKDGSYPCNSGIWLNGIDYSVTTHSENDGWEYMDTLDEDESKMEEGELYAGGRWIAYCGYNPKYLYENGIEAYSCVMEYEGRKLFCSGDTYTILCGDDYWIESGCFVVKKGYKGRILEPAVYTFLSQEPTIKCSISYALTDLGDHNVTVTEDGYITCNENGTAVISYSVLKNGIEWSSGYIDISVLDGRQEPDYKFRKQDISEFIANIDKNTFEYTGEEIRPEVTVESTDPIAEGFSPALTEGKDYVVTYKNNVDVGKATAVIKGAGNYKGTLKIRFQIVSNDVPDGQISDSRSKPTLKTVKILNPKVSKKSATIRWKKVKKTDLRKIKKIEIQYSTDKNFRKNVISKKVSAKKTSYKIKKLKARKKYYVRIRAYTKSGSKVHVSKWSAKKSFKAK